MTLGGVVDALGILALAGGGGGGLGGFAWWAAQQVMDGAYARGRMDAAAPAQDRADCPVCQVCQVCLSARDDLERILGQPMVFGDSSGFGWSHAALLAGCVLLLILVAGAAVGVGVTLAWQRWHGWALRRACRRFE